MFCSQFWSLQGIMQTIKSLARGPLGDEKSKYSVWYSPLETDDAIKNAVHWVLADPQVFLNSAGDINLLKKVLKDSHRKIMTSCCFDWLITNQRVACEVYAMSALYYLGTEYDWVHTELKTIIETNVHQRSAGYKARGEKVLAQITKFRHK